MPKFAGAAKLKIIALERVGESDAVVR